MSTFQPGQRVYTETWIACKRGGADVVRLHGVYIGEDARDRQRVVVRLDRFGRNTTPLRSIVFAAEQPDPTESGEQPHGEERQ